MLGIDDEPVADSSNLVESGGIYNMIAFKDYDSPYNDTDILKYLVDEENAVFAILYKDGHIENLAKTQKDNYIDNLITSGYVFGGLANPETNPNSPKIRIFYIAIVAGIYTNFDNIVVGQGINVLSFDGTQWILNVIYSVDDKPIENSEGLPKSGGVYSMIAFKDEESPYADPNIIKYLVDEENAVFAILYKDGSIKKFALTEEEQYEKNILNMISSDSIYNDENVLKYIVDENNFCCGCIKKDGTLLLYKVEIKDFKNETFNLLSQKSPYNSATVIKYLTDENGQCFGYIEKDGTVVIQKARIAELEGRDGHDVTINDFSAVLGLLATGVDNIQMSNNPKMMNILKNIFMSDGPVELNEENRNKLNLKPIISIIDDDTIDNQIPSSFAGLSPIANQGGFFSVLLPLTLSLSAKHNKKVPVGLACEGHRVGLTTYCEINDDYTELNVNGNAVKWLHDNMGWNVLNHSMTAQLPQRAYYVDGIDSALADKILAAGTYVGFLSFSNTMVLDRLTGKWWEINPTNTAWVERTPTKKYAQPFYREYINADDPSADHNGAWYFNRDFDFEYSWGEWIKRAEELELPFEKVIVHNGSTTSPYTISAGRKYAYFSVNTRFIYNYPPIPAAVSRTTAASSLDYNKWDDTWVADNKQIIDNCFDGNMWVIFMTHINNQTYFRNYYLENKDYPSSEAGQPELRAKDMNYPSEWTIPLKYDEILDIIGDNINDYINTPPSRLNISSWDEWHPAGGTQLAALYYILDYAMTKGIDIVLPTEGWNTHGNILNLGVDRNGQDYVYDSAE